MPGELDTELVLFVRARIAESKIEDRLRGTLYRIVSYYSANTASSAELIKVRKGFSGDDAIHIDTRGLQLHRVVEMLASAYGDHPDFKEEWYV